MRRRARFAARVARVAPAARLARLAAAVSTAAIALAATLAGFLFAPNPLQAQVVLLEFTLENDALTGIFPGRSNTDREYTHGMAFAVERDDAPGWGGLFGDIPTCGVKADRDADRDAEQDWDPNEGCLGTRLEAGQKIFTPNFRNPAPAAPERPFAGWLFGGVTARYQTAQSMRSVHVKLGVTGPPSLGEAFQRNLHRLVDMADPEGWNEQLAFEPGLLVQYGEARQLELRSDDGHRIADLVLASDVSVGNVRTSVRGEVAGRIGYRLPHPWRLSGNQTSGDERPFALYATATLRRQYTLRDLFLDGSTFENSPSVAKYPFTGSLAIGFGLRYGDLRVTYATVSEDRLYETQPRPHLYHSIGIAIDR